MARRDTSWAYSLGSLNGSSNLWDTSNAKLVFLVPSLGSAKACPLASIVPLWFSTTTCPEGLEQNVLTVVPTLVRYKNFPSYKCLLISCITISDVSTRTPISTWLWVISIWCFLQISSSQIEPSRPTESKTLSVSINSSPSITPQTLPSRTITSDASHSKRISITLARSSNILCKICKLFSVPKCLTRLLNNLRPAPIALCSISFTASVVGSVITCVAPYLRLIEST